MDLIAVTLLTATLIYVFVLNQQLKRNRHQLETFIENFSSSLNRAELTITELKELKDTVLKTLIEQYDKGGEFTNNEAARTLITHLAAVEHFDKQDQPEKVLKHMQSFKTILEHQKSEGDISETAFDTIYFVANDVIQQLENNEQNHVA